MAGKVWVGVVWVVGLALTIALEFGMVYVMISAIVLIFMNLRTDDSQDGVSGYSVFNRGGRRLAGEYDPREYDAHMRRGAQFMPAAGQEDEKDKNILKVDEVIKERAVLSRKSKNANAPCPCGSGKKYKKCCALINPNEKQEIEQWEKEWT
jgi:hypothetical protein